MRPQLLAAISALALSFGGLAACADVTDDADEAELEEGSDDAKTDRADLALIAVDAEAPEDVEESRVGVIKSRAAWKQKFGTTAPASIKFETHWVAYYTAGAQTSGGFTASITRVRLSDTGKMLKISTRLDAPGADCFTTQAITFPYAIVKFKKPSSPAPTTNRYFKETHVTSCGPSCANGTIVSVPTFAPIGSGNEECAVPDEHCVTNDHNACPQLTPLPPTFCPNGTVTTTRRFIASADGMECSMPTAHCVTNDNNACPQWSPLPPNWCPNGTIQSEPSFLASADGMECSHPRVHCVVDDATSCPL